MESAGPGTLELAIRAPLARSDLPELYARVCALMSRARSSGEIVLDVTGLAADAVCVDALAQLQLAAGRSGRRVRLRGASPELISLIELMGLEDVFVG